MKNYFSVIIMAILFIGCDKKDDDNCTEFRDANVVNVDAPKNGNIDDDIIFKVAYGVINGCGRFDFFKEVDIDDNTKEISVNTKYEGCICTQAAETFEVDYTFNTNITGSYQFKFKKNDTEFIIVNVLIE